MVPNTAFPRTKNSVMQGPGSHTFAQAFSIVIMHVQCTYSSIISVHSKILQTKMLVMCQRFGDQFLFGLVWQYSSNHKTCTLDSGINIGVSLLIFGLFSRATFLIREGNAYFISKYPLFDGMGDAHFKGYVQYFCQIF